MINHSVKMGVRRWASLAAVTNLLLAGAGCAPPEGDDAQPTEPVSAIAVQPQRLTSAELVTALQAIKKAYDHYKDFQSLINGADVDIVQKLNEVKTAIINEIQSVTDQALRDQVETSIRSYAEIIDTLRANPDGNNTVMINRISHVLENSLLAWTSLRNLIQGTKDGERIYKLVIAFNSVAALRVTVFRDMRQLNPPMPVAQSAIDTIVQDTLTTNYSLVGAELVLVVPQGIGLHHTVGDKKLYTKMHGQSSYDCQVTCNLWVYVNPGHSGGRSGYCPGTFHWTNLSVRTGQSSWNCGNQTCGVQWPAGLEIWETDMNPCRTIRNDAVSSAIENDTVTLVVREAIRAASAADFKFQVVEAGWEHARPHRVLN